MTEKKFSGLIIPAVTPLTQARQVDEAAVEKMFGHFYANGVQPFILGTTGESASLSMEQKKAYTKLAAKYRKDDAALFVGISANCFQESVALANECAEWGIDAVAATLPSYYALTESQMKQYFETLANAISVPLIIYNIPATTHMSIPLSVIDELSHHPNIAGAKDSERSDERLTESIRLWKNRADFSHFLGWAAKSAEALIQGSDGLIPSTGNLTPAIYQHMQKAVTAGNTARAYQLQELSDVFGNLYQSKRTLGNSLWALKVLMQQKGLCEAHVMPPLQAGNTAEANTLIQELKALEEKYPEAF